LAIPAEAGTFILSGVTTKVGVVPACVTVTITGVSPATATVILATRTFEVVFSSYVAVSVPFPDPEGVTVHHAALLAADHAEFDVTLKLVFPAGAVTFWLAGFTVSVGELPD
jgi:hypothetical protein